MASMTKNNQHSAAESHSRLESFDALKAILTLLVVLHHTAITYGASGGWFYREVQPSAALQSLALTYFCAVNQAYFMGFFFLLAGYFTPAALERKGEIGFLRDRLIRLGIPLLFFGFVLGPIAVAIAQTAYGADFLPNLLGQWSHLAFHLGPLWFAQALLLFSAGAVIFRVIARSKLVRSVSPTQQQVGVAYPAATKMLAVAMLTGIVAFIIRLYIPAGSTVWGLQLGYFPSYVVLFVVGCAAVILVSISVALLSLTLPPLLKFGLVGSLACLVCYFVAGLLLRVGVIRRIV